MRRTFIRIPSRRRQASLDSSERAERHVSADMPGPRVVVGIGLRSTATVHDVLEAIDAVVDERWSIAGLASLQRDTVEQAARFLGVPAWCRSADELAVVPVPTPSDVVADAVGTPSVAEAAALLCSGSELLVVPKTVVGDVTVAVAIASDGWQC